MTREKLKMQYGGFVTRAIVSTVLLASFLNPFTEATEYGNALVFMFSHYALFVAGFALTYKKVRLPGWTFILASIAAAYWHFPIPFALSGSIQIYRFLEEVSLILSGLIAGSALDSFSSKIKLIIFGLWVLGDTGLSVIFIILPGAYSSSDVALSPYPFFQFTILGVAMVFFMNAIVALVVYVHLKRIGRILSTMEK